MAFKNIFKTPVLFLIWFLPSGIKAQDTCVYLFTIPQNADFVAADHLANTYLLHGFEVEKYDSTGRFVSRYSNNRLGMPKFLDASNPLKVVVWYADFQTAVFLDRNMTELGRLNVAEAGWPSVASIAMASDGNLWVYDMTAFKLLKITTSGEKLIESQSLSFALGDEIDVSLPVTIKENGEKVFLAFEEFGIYAFDIFGQNPDMIELSLTLKQFEIVGNLLITYAPNPARIAFGEMGKFSQKGSVFLAQFLLNQPFWLSQKRIFVQTASGVAVYRF